LPPGAPLFPYTTLFRSRPQLRAGMDLGNGWESEQYRRYASVSVSQMVYDFGRTSNQVNRAKARSEVERANLLVQIDDLVMDVAEDRKSTRLNSSHVKIS